MILGVIADDFTGATDVASMLVESGMRTMLSIGIPSGPVSNADALVIALKSRTCPPEQAVRDSLAALAALRAGGARQIYFKYCSTFDSTPTGNIGPVAEALMQALGTSFTIACPAFPENGRTVFRGHLFTGDTLLSDSSMREHPLTPMRDSNLVRVLQAQVRGKVGLVRYDTVAHGVPAIHAALTALQSQGTAFAVVDAIDDDALRAIAAASIDLPLLTAGSGIALGLPAQYAAQGWLTLDTQAAALSPVGDRAAILSGSCSQATRGQVRHWQAAKRPARQLDALALAKSDAPIGAALDWAAQQNTPFLIYATAEPEAVQAAQAELGTERAGQIIERALATIACELVGQRVQRLVIAGGETSGAVVQALGVARLRVGPRIDPGVPWTQVEGRKLLLALKSGNFGTPDFFSKALRH